MNRVHYSQMRCNKRRGLERCPECGQVARVLRVPITRGENAGRTRVQWVHAEDREHKGFFWLVENVESCWSWE